MYDNFNFKHYFILFLDILGQRKALRSIKALPADKSGVPDFARIISDSYGKVSYIRKAFQEFYEIERNQNLPKEIIPREHFETYKDSQKFEVLYYGMSDSMVVAVPITDRYEHCSAVTGIYNSLVAACHVFHTALISEIVVRAGLDVGIAAQIEDREIYGPALERAYFLESNIADYPRMVIGSELLRYLDYLEKSQCATLYGNLAKMIGNQCKEIIIKDDDNQYMLDFLSSKMHQYTSSIITSEHFKRGMSFVQQQYEKCSEPKLKNRYKRLLAYFESRKDIWL